jgi:hypothetical protein
LVPGLSAFLFSDCRGRRQNLNPKHKKDLNDANLNPT